MVVEAAFVFGVKMHWRQVTHNAKYQMKQEMHNCTEKRKNIPVDWQNQTSVDGLEEAPLNTWKNRQLNGAHLLVCAQ